MNATRELHQSLLPEWLKAILDSFGPDDGAHFDEDAWRTIHARLSQIHAAMRARSTETAIKFTEVVGADGKGVAAPCAIDGCALFQGRATQAPSSTAVASGDEIQRLIATAAHHLRTWHYAHERGSKDMAPYANTMEIALRLDALVAQLGVAPSATARAIPIPAQCELLHCTRPAVKDGRCSVHSTSTRS